MSIVNTTFEREIKFGYGRHLLTQVAASSASIAFVDDLTNKFDVYLFDISDLLPTDMAAMLYMYVSGDGGATWLTTNYFWSYLYTLSHGVGSSVGSGTDSKIILCGNSANNSSLGGEVRWTRSDATFTDNYFSYQISIAHSAAGQMMCIGGGNRRGSGDVNGIKFQFNVGNIASGAIRLYGMRTGA